MKVIDNVYQITMTQMYGMVCVVNAADSLTPVFYLSYCCCIPAITVGFHVHS